MNLALFDFDGTITTHDTMPAFVRATVSKPRLLFGSVLLWPVVMGYRLGLISGNTIRNAIVRVAYTGASHRRLNLHGRRFSRRYLERCLRPEALARLAWHQSRGDTVVVVSGGLAQYLKPWAERRGLTLLCSELSHHNGKLDGRYHGAQCVGADKPRKVATIFDLSRYERIYAYGDSCEDRDMLAIATDAFYRQMPGPV